jgi:hypothetical protein
MRLRAYRRNEYSVGFTATRQADAKGRGRTALRRFATQVQGRDRA